MFTKLIVDTCKSLYSYETYEFKIKLSILHHFELSFYSKTNYVQCFIVITIGRLLFNNEELRSYFAFPNDYNKQPELIDGEL